MAVVVCGFRAHQQGSTAVFAKYDEAKEAYEFGTEWVPRERIVEKYPGLEGRGQDVQEALLAAYGATHDGATPTPNELHAWYMAYMDTERKLPLWMCKAFCKAQG